MSSRRITAFMVPAALCALCTLAPGDTAPAAAPKTLTELLPKGAVAVLEFDDLRLLLKRWSASRLHRRFDGSRAAHDLEKSRLYLRLAENVGQLEEVAGFGLSLERLTQLAGHRSAVAMYDVPSTSFVLVMELQPDEARRSDLLGQKGTGGKLAAREHRGVKYLLKEGARGKTPLAVALVGDRLIAGSDLAAFRDTLVLAARAAGLPTSPATGAEPIALAADPDVAGLFAAAPRGAPIRLWVDQKRLTGTHYFDDYWIFGGQSAAGIDSALIALSPGEDTTAETRIYLYAAGKRPDVTEDAAVEIGRADPVSATLALPAAPPFASAFPVDAGRAAEVIAGLLPRGAREDQAGDAAPIATSLASGKPRRAVEAIDPSHAKGGFAEHHGAVAIGLAAPALLDPRALEAALAAAVAPRVTGAGSALTFSDEGTGAAAVRALRLPLIAEWSLSWRRIEGGIVIATDPTACRKLAEALARPETAKLLAPSAPRLYRLDLDRAGTVWRDVTKTLAARDNWSDVANGEFYRESVGGLFEVARDTHRVVALGYARGPRHYVEEIQYRGK
ncbi:MAG: hypothetical protein EXR72_04605 [Myxococcales bacterium]|nr:hypothetical protein [Myxococcales bacterium]